MPIIYNFKKATLKWRLCSSGFIGDCDGFTFLLGEEMEEGVHYLRIRLWGSIQCS